MVNPNIAPQAELRVEERIKEIEKFLEEQEKKIIEPVAPPEKLEEPAPIEEPAPEDEAITLLKKISENQEIDRKRYERNNPVENDEPVYDWEEETIDPGFIVRFILNVPEGHVFYFEYLNITYNLNTTYYIWIDGAYEPILTDTLQDFGDHAQIYKPPKMCYNTAEVWCLNNGAAAQTYSCFFRGFLRWYRNIKREIEYESLKKTPEEKRGI